MDPFSKRLRKQRERSSLRARQLNKNALTMLKRQLSALERHEQQNARTMRRTKQAILEELEASRDIEHEGLEKRPDTPTRPRTLPPLATDPFLLPRQLPLVSLQSVALGENDSGRHQNCDSNEEGGVCDRQRSGGWEKSGLSSAKSCNALAKDVFLECNISDSVEDGGCSVHKSCFDLGDSLSSSGIPQSQPDRGRSETRTRHFNGTQGDNCEDLSCRFRALSPLSPCRYFPCRRPQSYHRMKVSDVDVPDNSLPFGGGGEEDVILSPRSQVPSIRSTDSSLLASETSVSRSSQSLGNHASAAKEGSSQSIVSTSKSRLGEGHASPRTSIQERLRGLKQVARQMRDRNEANKPRDWAVNYGDPVSKRLLRKPVVAVSELVI